MHGSKRATSLVVWLLVSQITLPARPVRALSTDASTLPTGRSIAPAGGAAAGAAPATDPFTGAASHTLPLELPPGTGGMTPQLALQYSSQARGDSWVGSGWSLGLPAITRSLKDGVPLYDDEADVFELAGQELVPETPNPALPRRYHTLRESFVRIVHEANNSWTLTRKDGVALRFGVTAPARLTNASGQVFQWLLEEQEDRNGNAFVASYDRRDPAPPIAAIRYAAARGGRRSKPGRQSGEGSPRRVRARTAPRSDVASHRAGFLSRIAHRLDYVDVKVGATLVRATTSATRRAPTRSARCPRWRSRQRRRVASPRAVRDVVRVSLERRGRNDGLAARELELARRHHARRRHAPGQGRPARRRGRRRATRSGEGARHAEQSRSQARDVLTERRQRRLPEHRQRLSRREEQRPRAPDVPRTERPDSVLAAWQDATRLHHRTRVLDVTGDGRADLVGGVRDLDPRAASGALRHADRYRGSPSGFGAASDPGRCVRRRTLGHEPIGRRRSLRLHRAVGHQLGQRALRGFTGDGLPELIVRGVEYRQTAVGGPSPAFTSFGWTCLDERLTNYYFENRGELRFERAPVVDSAGPFCQASLKRVATDFQHCDLSDSFADCGYQVLYNEAHPMQYAGDPALGTFPWYWLTNLEFGSIDVDLDGDGLADTLSASFDPYQNGYGTAATAWRNDGERGYIEDPDWALPADATCELSDHRLIHRRGSPT
jgi:hypothetical protein